MPSRPSRPILLIFTLGPERERARRRLLPGGSQGLEGELHRACLDEALAAGRSLGARVVISTPRRLDLPGDVEQVAQRGRDFGERLAAAIRAARPEADTPLVVVGTDAPGLTPELVATAFERLARDPDAVAIGPSPDGGVYLLGIGRSADGVLSRARWCRRDTRRSLEAALSRAGRAIVRLPMRRDLDRRVDLERWLARGEAADPRWLGLARRLAGLLAALKRPLVALAVPPPRPAPVRVRAVRGPPR